MKPKKNSGVWAYLIATGVLDTGDEEAIAKAKSEYWRNVNKAYKAERRKQYPEHILKFTPKEHEVIVQAAHAYHLSLSEFIKQSALAFITQRPLIPDPKIMRSIEATLTRSLTTIEHIAQQEKKNWLIAASDFTEVKTHIMHMRNEIKAIRDPTFLQPYNSAL